MVKIHPTAIVSKQAQLGDVEIGPYVIVEDAVTIGNGTKVMAHAYICSGTTIGDDCEVHMGAVLGHAPQHLKYKDAKTYLKIGDRNIFREYVTVHRGLEEGASTLVGNDNMFMGFAHIAHDCHVGNSVVICNNTLIAGHVTIEDGAFISGNCVVHQFARIGTLAMIGGLTRVNQDVVPYVIVEMDSEVTSLNLVGLRRANMGEGTKSHIKSFYKLLYRSGLTAAHAIKEAEKAGDLTPEVRHMIEFIRSSERGICKHRKISAGGRR